MPVEGSNASMIKESAARMARIGACWSPTFAPDGRTIAFISNFNGLPQVWKTTIEGSWPELVTALNDPISKVKWSPDGQWLALDVAPGGGMNRQVYVIKPDGSDLRRLTAGGRDNNWLGFWTRDGMSLTISSNCRVPDAMDAYLVGIASGEFRLVAENWGTGSLTDVNRDGSYAIAHRVRYRSNSDLLLIDLATREETPVTPHDGPGNFTIGSFSPDSCAIYLTSDQNRERIAFARILRDAKGQLGPIEVILGRDDADLQEFILSPDGCTAAMVWNVNGGRSELNFCDLVSLQPRGGPTLPAEVISDLAFSPDGRCLAFAASGSAVPQNIWLLEVASGQMQQITHGQHAGVDLGQLVQAELIHFPAHDGLELTGWLYRPTQFTHPGPVVLSFHGGPEMQERPVFNANYQALLAQGIAVLAPNVRGSSGFGKTFVNLDNGPLRINAVKDIKACIDYVTGSGLADPQRIGIMGGSYGGYMTMAGLTAYPDLFAAGVDIYGLVNFRTFFAQTEPWMAAVSKVEYGDPATEMVMLDQLSPLTNIARVKAPTLVIHGINDTNVPIIEAEQVVNSLRRQGVSVDYVLFPDEGHGFLKETNRVRSTTAIVEWFVRYLKAQGETEGKPDQKPLPVIPAEALPLAETVIGLSFTPSERDLMLDNVRENLAAYEQIRAIAIDNNVPPAYLFDPRLPGMSLTAVEQTQVPMIPVTVSVPDNLESAAFWPITALAALIRSRQITSVALTEMYLQRLKHYDPVLHCVVTFTEDRAIAQAQRADQEIAAGHYRGILHGIPYGLKDLLATRGIRTTWGAEPFIDQVIDTDATVVERLEAAGAVLIAKLSVGALAWGDVWFGGMTRTPWNTEEGSSGSSAGSASATAAGLVGFSIGTETYGSIVSPCTQCHVTGLRPTFGRVSRHGAMALSWTMDKIGPICRSVEDCAYVFDAIYGPDGKDLTVVDFPSNWNPDVKLSALRIGYLKDAFDETDEFQSLHRQALQTLQALGASLIPITLPDLPVEALNFILTVEAAAAFDELTRSNRDDMLTRQVKDAWPNVFRQARLIPAVEYVQANRVRRMLMQAMQQLMSEIDVYVGPSLGGSNLLLTNLTGHPAVVVPNGVSEKGTPCSLTFTGQLYDESRVLAVANAYQAATSFHLQYPPL